MTPQDVQAAARLSPRIRTWAIRVAVACLVLEVSYVIAANLLLWTGFVEAKINRRPEKTFISWNSAVTFFPGAASVKGFTLRSQTRKDQIYLSVAEADAWISLSSLITRTIHIRSVNARDVDFRYRERVDSPRRTTEKEQDHELPPNFEFYPEIPGLDNPPDPRPEDLYPGRMKISPWTIKVTGARVEGAIRVALNEIRISGEGRAGGGVTVEPRRSITIHRGKLDLSAATVVSGPDAVAENLEIGADVHIDTFPARGATLPEIVGGLEGTLTVSGRLSQEAAFSQQITPGLTTLGAGTLDARVELEGGVLQAGSELSLRSDAFHLRIMELDASGSAILALHTVDERGGLVTIGKVTFGDFQFVDPDDASVDIAGSGLTMNAVWDGFAVAGRNPASSVEVVIPRTRILDVTAFAPLLPSSSPVSIESGAGELEARLEVNEDNITVGRLDLTADDIVMKNRDTPFFADLEVHATLAQGDLQAKRFDISGTTIRIDDIADRELPAEKRQKVEPWFCDLELEHGIVTFGRPMTVEGSVGVKMHDIRPVVALLRDFKGTLRWLSLVPNVKQIDGTMNLDLEPGLIAVEDLVLNGKGLEVLGWIHVRDKKPTGRIFARHGALAAGMALDEGRRRIVVATPRRWFEKERSPPPKSDSPAGDGR